MRTIVEENGSWTRSDTIMISLTKAGKPTCRTCRQRISNIRIGIIFYHRDGYILIRWFHLHCIKPPIGLNMKDVEGLDDEDLAPFKDEIDDWIHQRRKLETLGKEEVLKRKDRNSSESSTLGETSPLVQVNKKQHTDEDPQNIEIDNASSSTNDIRKYLQQEQPPFA